MNHNYTSNMGNQTRYFVVSSSIHMLAAQLTADIIAILNNVCIISVIYFSCGIKEITGKFLLNQALADMGIAITYLVSTTTFIIFHGYVHHMIGFMKCFVFVFYCVAMQMLAGVTVILAMAITRPHVYAKRVSQKRARILILVIWILTLLLSGQNIWYELYHQDPTMPHMFLADQDKSYWWILSVNMTLLFVLPFITAFVSFTMIFCYCRKVAENQMSRGTAKHIRQALSILILGIVYTVTFAPVFMAELIFSKMDWRYWLIIGIFGNFNYLYMVIKFPLYLALFKQYRNYVKKLLRCRKSTVHAVDDNVVFTSYNSGAAAGHEETAE